MLSLLVPCTFSDVNVVCLPPARVAECVDAASVSRLPLET